MHLVRVNFADHMFTFTRLPSYRTNNCRLFCM